MINKNKSLPRWKYISADDEAVGPYFLCLPPETRRRDVSCLCISDLLLRSLEFYLNIDNRRLVGSRLAFAYLPSERHSNEMERENIPLN